MTKPTKTRFSLLVIAAVALFSVVIYSCNSAEAPAEEKKDTSAPQQAAPATVGPDTTAKSAVTDSSGTDTTGKGGQQTPPPPK